MKSVRVFVSSPADVEHERLRVERVVERLNGQYAGVVRLIPIRWEQKFYEARASFQAQIPEAASCDLVIGILWSRLGSELPPEMPSMPTGEPYPSGTAYEVLTAIEESKEKGRPSVYLFRKMAPAVLPVEDEAKRALVLEQLDRLKVFWERFIKTRDGHFKAGYQEFANPDQFESQLEALLREWLDERVLKGRSVVWPIATKGSPFRGLAAFGAKHAPVFFGRGSDITRAVDALKDGAEGGHPFLLLIGSSGSGKSSLARAGLSPRLTTPGVVGAVDRWRVAVMRPGERKGEPVMALAQHLFDGVKDIPADEEGRPEAFPELGKSSHNTPQLLAKALAAGDAASVVWALDQVAEAAREEEGYDRAVRADLLLIVDQLDELFAADVSEEERDGFAKAIAALVATGRVWVIATLRTDLYERLQQTPTLLQLKQEGAAYDLAPPGAAELAEIVRKPAEAAGLTFGRDETTGRTLDEQLLEDAGRPDMLPLVQFALQELFDRREVKGDETLLTFAAFSVIGGLDGAIDKRAEAALAGLGQAEQASLPRLLRQLALPAREKGGATSLTIRSVPLAEAAPDEASRRLVQALVDARILLSSGDEGTPSVRLAHERVLKSWKRAADIVRDNADFYRIREDVEDQLARWQAAKKSDDLLIPPGLALEEARKLITGYGAELEADTGAYVEASLAADDKRVRARRLRYRLAAAAAVLFAVLAIGAAAAGVLAWKAQQRATIEADRATAEAARAERNFTAAKDTVDSLIHNIAQGLRDVEGMRVETINKVLTSVRETVERLSATAPNNSELLGSRADMLDEFATTYLKAGSLQAAEQSARESLAIRRNLVEADKQHPELRQRSLTVTLVRLGDVLHSSGNKAAALAAYDESLAIVRKLVESNKNNTLWQWDLAVGLERIGDMNRDAGDSASALSAYEEEVEISRRLAEADKGNTGLQNSLGYGLVRVGDVKLDQGDKMPALAAYEEALAIRRHLAEIDEVNTEWQRNLSWSLSRVGDVNLSLGNNEAALAAYEESLAIRRQLADGDKGNTAWQSDLSAGFVLVGDAKDRSGDKVAALAAYEESLAIRRHLVETDKGNPAWRGDLSQSLERIGTLKLSNGDSAGALAAYEEDVTISRKLVETDETNATWQNNLGYGLIRIGDVKQLAGDRVAALAAYEENLAIRRHLVETDKSNAGWQRELAASLERIGNVKLGAGDSTDALASYEEALAIDRHLAEINNSNTDWQLELSLALIKIGDVKTKSGDRAAALADYEECLAIGRRLVETDKSNTRWQWNLAASLERIGDTKRDAGDNAGALAAYAEELAIYRHLAEINNGNTDWQRELSVALIMIGDVVKRSLGDNAAALAAYEECLAIRRRLVETDKSNTGWQWDLAVGLERIGDMKRDAGDNAGALAAYEEEAEISRHLVESDKDNTDWQNSLGFALVRTGDAKRGLGDNAAALAAYEECLAIRRHLVETNKDNTDWQDKLAFILTHVGDLKDDSGDGAGSLAALEEAASIRRRLAEAEGDHFGRQWDLSVALVKLGNVRLGQGDNTAARTAYREALAIDRGLAQKDPDNKDWQTAPAWDLYDIASASSGEELTAALDEALALLDGLEKAGGLSANQESLKKKLSTLRDGAVAKR
jgi:tetratricopeptide (TPR) repeat protein